MEQYTIEECAAAIQVISSTIIESEKIQPKFAEGTSQHSLLKNRIKALNISKLLLEGQDVMEQYTKEELTKAIPPVSSIISKCEKAQLKFVKDTGHYIRLEHIIKAMYISKSFLLDKLENME